MITRMSLEQTVSCQEQDNFGETPGWSYWKLYMYMWYWSIYDKHVIRTISTNWWPRNAEDWLLFTFQVFLKKGSITVSVTVLLWVLVFIFTRKYLFVKDENKMFPQTMTYNKLSFSVHEDCSLISWVHKLE